MRLALAALLTCTVAGLAGCSDSGSDSEPEPTSASDGPEGLEVTELDSGAVGVADVDGGAWTAIPDEGAVRTADGTLLEVGEAPLRLVGTPDGVWVSVIGDGTVVRVDPATGALNEKVELRPRGSEPEGVAWDGRSLWVVDQAHDRVVQLDVAGEVVGQVPVDDGPRLVTVGETGVWVTNYAASTLTRVNGDRGRTIRLVGCVGPQGVAEVAGRIWVACTMSGKAVAVDARTLEVVAELDDLPDADAVVPNGDQVYVVGQSGPTVYVVDAASGELTDTIPLDTAPPTGENVGAAVVGDRLVVTHPDVRRMYSLPLP